MSKSNPFDAPQALVDVPGALEAIAETARRAEPMPPNHDAPARVDSGAAPVSLNDDGENQFGGIPADSNPTGNVAVREDGPDNGAAAIEEESRRAADATTADQTGETPFEVAKTADGATTGANEASDTSTAPDGSTVTAPEPVNPASHDKDELIAMADEAGVDNTGTKAEIAARINEKNGV